MAESFENLLCSKHLHYLNHVSHIIRDPTLIVQHNMRRGGGAVEECVDETSRTTQDSRITTTQLVWKINTLIFGAGKNGSVNFESKGKGQEKSSTRQYSSSGTCAKKSALMISSTDRFFAV
ncbi:hypothetical protein PoB_000172200 [Plakobranchus ocellatus]|uniref:Uncharacterized protein n=1 Tax=Plakobranchus ocellatus TaxID=259542 RepID=A0AAV3XZD8_9GAST|nr:hypothetical protein PoB_000172200 [Plakobranchus ocellatus]